MKKRAAAVSLALLVISGCTLPEEGHAPEETLQQWFQTAEGSIRRNSLSAPVGARILAYLAFAADASYSSDGRTDIDFLPASLRSAGRQIEDPDLVFATAAALILSDLIPVPSDTFLMEKQLQEAAADCRDCNAGEVLTGISIARAVSAAAAADRYAGVPHWSDWEPEVGRPDSWRVTSTPPAPPTEPYWGQLIPLNGSRILASCRIPPPDEDFAASSLAVTAQLGRGDENRAQAARFWDDPDGITGGPAAHWVRIALNETVTWAQWRRADLLRDMTSAMHDANILVWEAKYRYNVPRPSSFGVRPLLTDPPHPEYPSAHAAVSAAAAAALERYGITGFTDRTQGIERTFQSPAQAAEEAAWSRVWAGIHREESAIRGAEAGACVAEESFRNR